MIGGTHGKLLHVDLTAGRIQVESLPDEVYRLLAGGRALVAYLLLRDLPPGADPLGPENLLIFAPGVMQGTNFPGAGRHGVGGKSPLTGVLGSSEVGGWWGHEFKRTGFDALVVSGRAASPVYLWIHDGEAEIRPAEGLWGLATGPAQAAIRQELGDKVRVAQIGPAGENGVRYAAIMHDVNRAAGRNGLGAVMGSKNLKAVAVRGTRNVPIADRKRVTAVARWLGENYRKEMAWATSPTGRGTQDGLTGLAAVGGLPTRNFGVAVFEHPELLSGERNYAMFLKGRDTCHGCPVACKQVFQNEDPDPYRRLDPVYGGAEYEAMGAFGSSCGVEDNLAVLKANELANAYGLDAISTGMSIAFAMECFENGLLTTADTGGLDYRWGDGALLVRSVEMIAGRQGFGDFLAEGVARMAARIGPAAEPFNVTVRRQELPMHEPRLKPAMGVGYAVAPVGADHQMNMHDTAYLRPAGMRRVNSALAEPLPPLARAELDENKSVVFYHELNWSHFLDCALICQFYCYDYAQMAEAMSGVTGVEYGIHDILAIGERAQTLSRLLNLREGSGAEEDRLPRRVMTAFEAGPLEGSGISDQDFAWFLRRFYERMGWDPETGEPARQRLEALGIAGLLA
ncbi:MAG: aldehyde ferredoxin oxidoreductase family protein [Anaerolineae bacterium]|jgi:aldehyde:ferredoxin oxidoreductase|nr:aldehyde ferredoxin oxidoreductase family protein [Anaerolineae bacterium]